MVVFLDQFDDGFGPYPGNEGIDLFGFTPELVGTKDLYVDRTATQSITQVISANPQSCGSGRLCLVAMPIL